jgi:hypothetical protein
MEKTTKSKKANARTRSLLASLRSVPAVEAIRREAKAKSLDRLTMGEINKIIKECRLEHRNREERKTQERKNKIVR